ncbi:hypothetical protein D477_013986 [Arthrobacter crystallopoietes BAB-32]|uniref:Cell division protein FtsL n=1 Tax=Arthrobacter crystallopoietes BAB-32 TaxID=1246476 RepID=N1UT65_9MICC|nr:hypothetical protein [Arthrobacter crystallopoietes]EMY33611.1 hypothetical protein D477_013986 [Arthrobacter crystallopoietes BAB-32]
MSVTARSARPAAETYVHGSSARVLSGGQSQPKQAEPRRVPLSVVSAGPARKRIPFAVFCFAVLVAALGCVLMLNISVSGGQYEIVQLRGEQVALAQQNEKLTQQLENRQAPQNLAAEAAELGMVVSPSVGSIDLETMKVSGKPEAAKEGSAPKQLVERPELPVQAPAAASPEAKKLAAPVQEEEPPAAAQDKKPAPADRERAADEPKVQTFSEAELNGGTIPAPKQKTGQ